MRTGGEAQDTSKSCNQQIFDRSSNPITGLDIPWGFQEFEAARFQDSWHVKVVRLSALCTNSF